MSLTGGLTIRLAEFYCQRSRAPADLDSDAPNSRVAVVGFSLGCPSRLHAFAFVLT
jgi:hypothetical protein